MIQDFLINVADWAKSHSDILGVALVGSHARDEARVDSDIDLVILCEKPNEYINDTAWTNFFGVVSSSKLKDWGKLTSVNVWFDDGQEVEFGFTNDSWATFPLDSGTEKVILNGFKIVWDRKGYFKELETFLN